MSDPSGSLTIDLRRTERGAAVEIGSNRPVSAARVFSGRPVAAAAAGLPLLYSVCATAQAAACAAACEEALGQRAAPLVQQQRALLLAGETVKEHLWRLLLDWSAALGRPPEAAAMAEVMRAWHGLRSAMDAEGALFRLGFEGGPVAEQRIAAAARELAGLVHTYVFGAAPALWLQEVRDEAGLADWAVAKETPAAALVRRVLDEDLAGLGCNPIQPLPPTAMSDLACALATDAAGRFAAAPTWRDAPRETTPFGRCRDEPLIAALAQRHGNGLLPRLAALLVELAGHASLLSTADEDAASPEATPRSSRPKRQPTAVASADPARGEAVGLGTAEAARGLLVHWVGIADGRISDYRVLAPTEWNFHPAGAVAAGLQAIAETGPTDAGQVTRLARLLITAIDPCVAYRLSVS